MTEVSDFRRRLTSISTKDKDFIARLGSGSLDCDLSNIDDRDGECDIEMDDNFLKFQIEH